MAHGWFSMAGAAAFVWLGMVVAISFLEAPLKFHAPGVSVPIGLQIGRIVFRALNRAELVLALLVVLAVAVGHPPPMVVLITLVVAALLGVQLAAVRPRLNRRSDRILAGEALPRSRIHLVYIGLEVAKAIALLVLGVTVLSV
jgi:hypothetical protein